MGKFSPKKIAYFTMQEDFLITNLKITMTFDLNPFDKAIVDTVIRLDEEYAYLQHLKPESVFFVLHR